MFDFLIATVDVKSKEIKRATLTEIIDYITTTRNVLSDQVYPEIIKMVHVLHKIFHIVNKT